MKNFISIGSLFLALFPLFSARSFAMTPDEIKSAVYQKMRDRHPVPDPNFWSTLGPESVPVLEEMFQASNSPVEQSWLIDGLSHFNDPSIASVLETGIQNSDNDVFRKKMLSALVDSQGESSFDFVEPYLRDKDAHTRLAVAIGMKRAMPNFPKASDRLKLFNAEEKEAWVKKDLEKSTDVLPTRLKRAGSVYEEATELKPLPEKNWVGLWSGVWVSEKKTGAAKATLSPGDKEKTWKVSLKLPKQNAYDLKRDGMEVLVYTSSHLYWIEVRNKKDDSVFIGQRKP